MHLKLSLELNGKRVFKVGSDGEAVRPGPVDLSRIISAFKAAYETEKKG